MKSGVTQQSLKSQFPTLEVHWNMYPTTLASKSEMIALGKWKEGLQPIGVKGNTRVKQGYYFLYQKH